jgi:hypothetical protein
VASLSQIPHLGASASAIAVLDFADLEIEIRKKVQLQVHGSVAILKRDSAPVPERLWLIPLRSLWVGVDYENFFTICHLTSAAAVVQ